MHNLEESRQTSSMLRSRHRRDNTWCSFCAAFESCENAWDSHSRLCQSPSVRSWWEALHRLQLLENRQNCITTQTKWNTMLRQQHKRICTARVHASRCCKLSTTRNAVSIRYDRQYLVINVCLHAQQQSTEWSEVHLSWKSVKMPATLFRLLVPFHHGIKKTK